MGLTMTLDPTAISTTRPNNLSGMRATQNPVLFTLGNPLARRLLILLDASSPMPYEETRIALKSDSQTFHRVTRRLAGFDLVRLQKARPGEFKDPKVRLTLRISPRGREYVVALEEVERSLIKQKKRFGASTVKPLRVSG